MSIVRHVLACGALSLAAPLAFGQGETWQNPGLAPNNGNNIHNDSYMSDNYTIPGPTAATGVDVKQVIFFLATDPATRQLALRILGECATQTFDAAGNLYTVCAGLPLNGQPATKSLVAFDPDMKVLAWQELPSGDSGSTTDFGGGGYFYLDDQYRPVVAQANGHLAVYQPLLGTALLPGSFTTVRDIDLTAHLPTGDKLYSSMPDKAGNIWWTSGDGMVGTIAPDDTVRTYDLNDPKGSGTRVPADASGHQTIANSLAVDEGDSARGGSGVYIVSTHKLYRFGVKSDGTPKVNWSAAYKRGNKVKPGQVSRGSGTTPTVFGMAGRRYVAIADNATPMNVNIYRAEIKINGEKRLFAQVQPFATAKSADENSLIAYPTVAGVALFAENNWGYSGLKAVGGALTTEPGFARIDVTPDGAKLSGVNNTISVPSVVSKSNSASGVVYTYNKSTDGYWYLTGLAPDDVNRTLFSVAIGERSENVYDQAYNNHYSALSLGPDGALYVGSIFGITQMRLR
jgi:hypothetical protein